MKFFKYIIFALALAFSASIISSCGSMKMNTNAGVNVNFGPNGPRVDPYMNVGFYSGGRRY